MGNATSNFLIDRIICTNLNIYVGVIGGVDTNDKNILKHQGIRIGSDNKISELKNFIKTERNLIYEFDSDIKLSVFKRQNNEEDVYYNIKTKTINITSLVDPLIRQNFKKIGMSISDEIDSLESMFKSKF